MKKLAQTDFASRQRLDTAEAAFRSTSSRLDGARQQLALAVEGPRKEDIAAQRARVAAARAALLRAEEDLRDARLVAPLDGVVRERVLEPGDMASPERPVFTIAQTRPVYVRVYIPEMQLGRVKPGMAADVRTDSYPGKVYRGWVGYVSPKAEFTPKQVETPELRSKLVYQARVIVCNPENELRLGMPATVEIAASGDGVGADTNRCEEPSR